MLVIQQHAVRESQYSASRSREPRNAYADCCPAEAQWRLCLDRISFLRCSRLGMRTLNAKTGARALSPTIMLQCLRVQACESAGSRARNQVAGGETITGQKTRKGRQRSRSHASATGADAGNSDDPGLCEASLLRVLVGQVWSGRGPSDTAPVVGGDSTKGEATAIRQNPVSCHSARAERNREGISLVRCSSGDGGPAVPHQTRQSAGEGKLRESSASTAACRPSNKGA